VIIMIKLDSYLEIFDSALNCGVIRPREYAIIKRRLGIGGEKHKTFREIGEEMGVSSDRIRQLECNAISKISRRLEEEKVIIKEKIKENFIPDVVKFQLSSRTLNVLKRENLLNFNLLTKTENDLMDIDGLGVKGVREIKRELGIFGILLKN